MRQQDWFALDEYKKCRNKVRSAKFIKHFTPPIWLILLGFGVFYNIPWWFLLISSSMYCFSYVKLLPKINHTLKISGMAMFCLEIEFGFSKFEDNLELAEEIKETLK
jgi:hypothetical protein